jgi:LysM repeat protein
VDPAPARPAPPAGRSAALRRAATGLIARLTVGGLLLVTAGTLNDDGAPADRVGPDRTGTSADATGTALTLVSAGHPRSHPWKGHPGRRIVHYRVRSGDTATELAVRFHAWTAELLSLNHLGARSTLYVGQRIRIPVVVAAARKPRHHTKPEHHTKKPHAHRPPRHGWRGADASRAKVRRIVVSTAHRHDVSPTLALAVAWQESGWQQRRISYAGAIGVMQVLPSTGRWMEMYVGHRLHLRRLHHNVTAGVVLLDVLRSHLHRRRAVAGYYQGIGSVSKYGMYVSTRHYVANVFALRKRLANGWNPA